MPDPVEVALSREYAHAVADFGHASEVSPGAPFRTVTLREPLLADQVAAMRDGGIEMEVERRLVAACSGLSVATLGAFAFLDWLRVEEAVWAFIGAPALEQDPAAPVRLTRSYAGIEALELREPTLDDVILSRVDGGSEIERDRRLASILSGVPETALDGFGMVDWHAVEARLLGFTVLPASPPAMPAPS